MNRFVWEESDFNEILKSDDIEKANPYHDELGRFTFAPEGKRPNIKRGASKGKRRKIIPKGRKVYSMRFSGSDDMLEDFGAENLVKAGILSINDLKICAMQYADSTPDFIDERNVDMGYVPSGDLQEPSIFYKIVSNKLLANGLRKSVSTTELVSAVDALTTMHNRIPNMTKVELGFDLKMAVEQDVLHEEFARYVVDSWAGSSGSQMSLFTSASARAFLDADGVFVGESDSTSGSSSQEVSMSKVLYYLNTGATPKGSRELVKTLKAVVQTTYENTQKLLDSQGITHVRVYRGHKGDISEPSMDVDFRDGRVVVEALTTRPLSSWSLNPKIASEFGTRLTTLVVKKEQVYSVPSTGIGCLEEAEVVLKGFDYTPAPLYIGALLEEVNYPNDTQVARTNKIKANLDSLADEIEANPEKYEVY